LKAEGSSWEEKLKYNPQYLWCLVRRTIPPSEELFHLLSGMFKTYGYLKMQLQGSHYLVQQHEKVQRIF
jgi:hypothetical protein